MRKPFVYDTFSVDELYEEIINFTLDPKYIFIVQDEYVQTRMILWNKLPKTYLKGKGRRYYFKINVWGTKKNIDKI